jgi:hypothetical protein
LPVTVEAGEAPAAREPRWSRSGFLGNVAVLAGGTALGQAINVLASPILTRLYRPEEVGLLGLYTAFIGIASVGAALRYETAIVSARSAREAAAFGSSWCTSEFRSRTCHRSGGNP